jgi:hypothetical protein
MLHTHNFTEIRKVLAPKLRLRPGQSLASDTKTARNPSSHESLHVQSANMTRPAAMTMGASKNTSAKYVAEQDFLGDAQKFLSEQFARCDAALAEPAVLPARTCPAAVQRPRLNAARS